MSDFQEAVKDTEWFEKLKQIKTTDEFLSLCQSKGINFSEGETIALLPNNKAVELSDEELEQATGGFHVGVSLDLCQKEYSHFCDRMFWGKCEHFKYEYENHLTYVTCAKGYFKKIHLVAL
jgi:predicted ribosomally synthesized peptide with nif11-like leader